MKPSTLSCLVLAALVLAGTQAVAQGDPITRAVNLSSQRFAKELPFDVPFDITGKAPDGVHEIILNYCIQETAGGGRARDYFPNATLEPGSSRQCDCAPTFNDLVYWRREVGADFALPVGRLHPDTRYSFFFRLGYRAADLPKAKELKAELVKLFEAKLAKDFEDDVLTKAELESLDDELNKELFSLLAKAFKVDPGRLAGERLDLTTGELDSLTTDLLQHFQNKQNALARLEGRAPTPALPGTLGALPKIRDALCLTAAPSCIGGDLVSILRTVLSSKAYLAPDARYLWESPVGIAQPTFAAVTMEDLAPLVADALEFKIGIREILDGLTRIEGLRLLAADAHDPVTFDLLARFFWKLGSTPFENSGIDPRLASAIRSLGDAFADASDAAAELAASDTVLAALRARFPDVAADVVLERVIMVPGFASGLTDGKHRYLSLDTGYAYAPDLEEGFFYYGTNIYLVPVNKDPRTRFSDFEGRDKILKRASLLLGVTSGGPDGEGVEKLFSGGNVVVGAGFRVARSVRLNAGVVLFKVADPNPLLDDTSTEGRFFASVSLDLDLKAAVGKLAELGGK